jgi:hypothetical protein
MEFCMTLSLAQENVKIQSTAATEFLLILHCYSIEKLEVQSLLSQDHL